MKILSRLGFCAAMLVLAACEQNVVGAFSADGNIETAKMAGPPTQPFDAALQQEYLVVAEREVAEADWEHGDLFARKAIVRSLRTRRRRRKPTSTAGFRSKRPGTKAIRRGTSPSVAAPSGITWPSCRRR